MPRPLTLPKPVTDDFTAESRKSPLLLEHIFRLDGQEIASLEIK